MDHVLTWMTFFPLLGAAVIVALPGRYKDAFKYVAVFAIYLVVVLIRPQGLFGEKIIERV